MPNCVKDGWGGICPGCDGAQCVVPTGAVPRFIRAVHHPDGSVGTAAVDPVAELEHDLLAPEPGPGPMKGTDHFIYNPPLRRSAVARAAVLHRECATMPEAERCGQCKSDDHIQKVVDDYLMMERKAQAWDLLLVKARTADGKPVYGLQLAALMDAMLRP